VSAAAVDAFPVAAPRRNPVRWFVLAVVLASNIFLHVSWLYPIPAIPEPIACDTITLPLYNS